MGSFTKKSRIEYFRRKQHGANSRFRFLSDSEDGYQIEFELTEKFRINRRFSSEVGALIVHLTFDAPSGFDFDQIAETCYKGDLVAEDESYKRYAIQAETPPTATTENRYRFILEANFGDETEIAV